MIDRLPPGSQKSDEVMPPISVTDQKIRTLQQEIERLKQENAGLVKANLQLEKAQDLLIENVELHQSLYQLKSSRISEENFQLKQFQNYFFTALSDQQSLLPNRIRALKEKTERFLTGSVTDGSSWGAIKKEQAALQDSLIEKIWAHRSEIDRIRSDSERFFSTLSENSRQTDSDEPMNMPFLHHKVKAHDELMLSWLCLTTDIESYPLRSPFLSLQSEIRQLQSVATQLEEELRVQPDMEKWTECYFQLAEDAINAQKLLENFLDQLENAHTVVEPEWMQGISPKLYFSTEQTSPFQQLFYQSEAYKEKALCEYKETWHKHSDSIFLSLGCDWDQLVRQVTVRLFFSLKNYFVHPTPPPLQPYRTFLLEH